MKEALTTLSVRDPTLPEEGLVGGEPIDLAALPEVIGACKVRGTLRGDCAGITYDSRRVEPGMVFAALPGQHADGADYLEEAIARGAVAVLGRGLKRMVRRRPAIDVDNPRRAMAGVAAAIAGHPSVALSTVGITGTNGKSSVAYLVRDILRAAGHSPGLIGTLHYDTGIRCIPAERTTPESPDLQAYLAEMVRGGCDHAVMEVSSHALVQERVRAVAFNVALFTNLTQDHLDFHGDMNRYFEAKAALFSDRGYGGADMVRIVNADDAWGRKLALRLGSHNRLLTYGTCSEARVRAEGIHLDAQGIAAEIQTPWGRSALRLSMMGRFNLLNALAAVAAGGALGLPLYRMVDCLSRCTGAPGRLERITNSRGILAFVDYAHTEDALHHVLRTVRETADRQVVCVVGCGGDRDRLKRPRMGAAATRWADVTVLTTDNPRSEDPMQILRDIEQGCAAGADVRVCPDRREAIELAVRLAAPGDVLVVAGKGHETTMEVGSRLVPFDDRAVLRDVLCATEGS